jgi:thiamine-phosphate pyrophosphorylase
VTVHDTPLIADIRIRAVDCLFESVALGDAEVGLSMMTDEIVIDRSNSSALWRGISEGKADARAAFTGFLRAWEDLGGVRWEQGRLRLVGRRWVAVETRILGRGPATGLSMDATGAWMLALADGLIEEAKMFQSYDESVLEARRRALAEARLYFVCDALPNGSDPGPLLEAAIRGGVDMIQLREKAPRCAEELIAFAEPFARAAREHGALFWLNDEPGLVDACGADGVHVGQDDAPVAEARADAGSAALVGLSTHSAEQFDAAMAALGDARPDQLSAGPVWETPTKAGRPAAGLGLIEHAARVAPEEPWFAIGGIDASKIGEVAAAGARRAVVVRAIRDAGDPEAAARELRAGLDSP